ncbi:MAG: hypothetical protein LUG98_06105 [Tannerellaceae bacterium]|nr:hypothetical protein [Tannerellaceae bacterium]
MNDKWTEYVGYYPDMHLHAVRSCSVSGDLHGFADLFLVDAQTGLSYFLAGDGDYNNGVPAFSPDYKYMAFIDTDYDYEAGYVPKVKVFRVHSKDSPENLFSFFNETEFVDMDLANIVWINETEFLVAQMEVEWEDEKRIDIPVSYYKVSLPAAEDLLQVP